LELLKVFHLLLALLEDLLERLGLLLAGLVVGRDPALAAERSGRLHEVAHHIGPLDEARIAVLILVLVGAAAEHGAATLLGEGSLPAQPAGH
jgi:hypothetical protein